MSRIRPPHLICRKIDDTEYEDVLTPEIVAAKPKKKPDNAKG